MSAIYTFKCHKISGGVAEGQVLCSKDDINFYVVDPEKGVIIEKGHAIEGMEIGGRVLVFPSGKGSSVVQADGLYQLNTYGNAPRAMIIKHPDTVLVASCIIMEVPLVDRVEEAFYSVVEDGDTVTVDADNGLVTVKKKE